MGRVVMMMRSSGSGSRSHRRRTECLLIVLVLDRLQSDRCQPALGSGIIRFLRAVGSSRRVGACAGVRPAVRHRARAARMPRLVRMMDMPATAAPVVFPAIFILQLLDKTFVLRSSLRHGPTVGQGEHARRNRSCTLVRLVSVPPSLEEALFFLHRFVHEKSKEQVLVFELMVIYDVMKQACIYHGLAESCSFFSAVSNALLHEEIYRLAPNKTTPIRLEVVRPARTEYWIDDIPRVCRRPHKTNDRRKNWKQSAATSRGPA